MRRWRLTEGSRSLHKFGLTSGGFASNATDFPPKRSNYAQSVLRCRSAPKCESWAGCNEARAVGLILCHTDNMGEMPLEIGLQLFAAGWVQGVEVRQFIGIAVGVAKQRTYRRKVSNVISAADLKANLAAVCLGSDGRHP